MLVAAVGCGKDSPPMAPSGSANTPPPPPSVTRVSLSGNVNLTAVGETSQLTATATFSDNTTRDVTAQARWAVGDPSVAVVSPTGLLTILKLGRTFVSAVYQNLGMSATITATPPGTFVIAGRVREPGQSGLYEALVVEMQSGLSDTTDEGGEFSVAGVADGVRLSVTKANYESRIVDGSASANVDVPLQQVIRLTVGESASPPPLSPNDLEYFVNGVRCRPCRMIRIVVPTAGDVDVRMTWTGTWAFTLLADGRTFQADAGAVSGTLPVPAPQELVVFFGLTSGSLPFSTHVAFTVEATRP
jgi:hypothetical protein